MKILLFLSILMASCTKEPLPTLCTKPDCDTTKIVEKDSTLTLVWQMTMGGDDDYNPGVYVSDIGKYVVSNYNLLGRSKLLFVNKQDTQSHRFINPTPYPFDQQFYHPEAGLIAIDYKTIYIGRDAASMHKIAAAPTGTQFSAHNNLIGDELYLPLRNESRRESYLIRVNIFTGEIIYDRILRDIDYPGYEYVNVDAPCYFVLENNDTLIAYDYWYSISSFNSDHKGEVYKKSTGELLYIDTVTYNYAHIQYKTINYKDQMIISADRKIKSINPLTGKVLWETPAISSRPVKEWATGNLILLGDIICTLDEGHYVEIKASNGAVLYDSPQICVPTSASKINYFEGVFYWTAASDGYSYIFGLRASDHKVVLKMRSPNSGKPPYYDDTNYSTNGVVIDPESRLLYTADGFFAQCFRIPLSY